MARPAMGTGAHHILVSICNKGSWRVQIGKELYRAIGKPRRVILTRRGMVIHIAPVLRELNDKPVGYAVVGGTTSMPRISIGKNIACDEYDLELRKYEMCHVRHGEIVVFL